MRADYELEEWYTYVCNYSDESLFVYKDADGHLSYYIAEWFCEDSVRDCAWDYVDTKQEWLNEVNNNWYEYSRETFEEDMYIMDYYDFYDNHNEPPSEVFDILDDKWIFDQNSSDWAMDWNQASNQRARSIMNSFDDSYEPNEELIDYLLNSLGREEIKFLNVEPIR